ncbi:MAG: roadblock/LC7 domain-containing protein [Promethearchaeota archaeon]|jgi:predicted regulator of Ras-like GTPase activity (Roadblock/LC7/MglB family)
MKGIRNGITQEDRDLHFILNELMEKGNFSGIILAHKDGEILKKIIRKNVDSKKFTSMCATVLESAVGLGKTIGSQHIIKIIAELEENTILLVQITEKNSFIVCILNSQTDSNFISNQLDVYISKIKGLS